MSEPGRPSGSGSPARRGAGQRRAAAAPREIDAETRLGAVYMGSLLREQLRLALRILRRCWRSPSARCRCSSTSCPGSADVRVARRAAALAAARRRSSTRVLVLLGWRYVRRAERNERDFADLVDEAEPVRRRDLRRPGIVAVAPGHRRDPGDRHLGAAVLPHHQRLLRRLAHGPARGSTPARSAASTSPPRPSSASPGWCSPSAPTCSGTPSAGPPATSCCWCWSPRRCAARAPTRCPTSPRPGSGSRAGARASARCWWWRSAGSTCCRSSRAPGVTLQRRRSARPTLAGRGRRRASSCSSTSRSGGMRSITFVQAFQYWLKLTALLVPAVVLLVVWVGDGAPNPADAGRRRRRPVVAAARATAAAQGLYVTYSLIIATFLGTMGLPHVVVRFYTNPDGRAARRTTLVVLGLLGVFYLLPAGVRRPRPALRRRAGRVRALRRAGARAAAADGRRGSAASCSPALVTAGAFAAFLSTSLGPGDRGRRRAQPGRDRPALGGRRLRGVTAFRVGAVVAVVVPCAAGARGARRRRRPDGRAGLRGRRLDVLPAAAARHLVARAHRTPARSPGCSSAASAPASRSAGRCVTTATTGLGGGAARASRRPGACPLAFATMVVVSRAHPRPGARPRRPLHGPAAHPRGRGPPAQAGASRPPASAAVAAQDCGRARLLADPGRRSPPASVFGWFACVADPVGARRRQRRHPHDRRHRSAATAASSPRSPRTGSASSTSSSAATPCGSTPAPSSPIEPGTQVHVTSVLSPTLGHRGPGLARAHLPSPDTREPSHA